MDEVSWLYTSNLRYPKTILKLSVLKFFTGRILQHNLPFITHIFFMHFSSCSKTTVCEMQFAYCPNTWTSDHIFFATVQKLWDLQSVHTLATDPFGDDQLMHYPLILHISVSHMKRLFDYFNHTPNRFQMRWAPKPNVLLMLSQ